MLLSPSNKAIPEIRESLPFLSSNHPTKNAITTTSKKGKTKPRKEINHQVRGLICGTIHDSRKKNTTAILNIIKNRLVKSRNLLAITAI